MDNHPPYRVLVVDDEPDFRDWLQSLLDSSKDFQVIGIASTGEETVSLIPSLAPDLVIADMYIPEPDGLEVARCVQAHFPDTKAVLISAQADRVYDRLAKQEGALAFIPKAGFSLDVLRQALQGEG